MRAAGSDISKWQGSFEPQGNIDFIFQRTSYGLTKDEKFKELLPGVKTIERRGAYHYFDTELDPIEQADFFYRTQGNQGFKVLAIDYEGDGNELDEQGEENLWQFYQKLKSLTDKKIILYLTEYTYFMLLMAFNTRWEEVDLWIARWNESIDSQTGSPMFNEDWPWFFWQYSAGGNGLGAEYGVESVDIDLDVFNGTVEELDAFLLLDEPVPPPIPPTNCDELIAEAVVRVRTEFTEKIEALEQVHQADLLELRKAHALMMEAAIIKANNQALENLIKPYMK